MALWKRTSCLAFVLMAMTAAIYGKTLSDPFVLDDISKIERNPDIRHLDQLSHTLIYPYETNQRVERNDPSRPFVYLVYAVVYHFWGATPLPYHLINLFLHWLCGLLVFLILRTAIRTQVPPLVSAGFAVLFLVLPINGGTAVYACSLSDVLATFSILLMIFLTFRSSSFSWSRHLLLSSVFILSLLTKQSSVVAPFLCILCDVFIGNASESGKWNWPKYIPSFTIALAYLVWRFWIFGSLGDLEAFSNHVSPQEYFLTQGPILWKYIQLTLIPHGLTLDHDLSQTSFSYFEEILSWVLWVLMAMAATLSWRRQAARKTSGVSWIACGILFYLIAMAPTSSILPTSDLLVERRAYLASVGLIVIFFGISKILAHVCQKSNACSKLFKPFSSAAIVTLIISFALLTIERNRVFASPVEVWKESLRVYPDNPRALNNLGVFEFERGNYGDAKALFEKVLQRYPEHSLALNNLALVYESMDYVGFDLNKALQIDLLLATKYPQSDVIAFNTARILHFLKGYGEAEKLYLRAIQLNPGHDMAHAFLARLYLEKGQKEMALVHLKEALSLNPQNNEAQNMLSAIH